MVQPYMGFTDLYTERFLKKFYHSHKKTEQVFFWENFLYLQKFYIVDYQHSKNIFGKLYVKISTITFFIW